MKYLVLTLCSLSIQVYASEPAAPHWTYNGHGGPKEWGKLSQEWKTCELGHQQSPIDLKWKKPNAAAELAFDYKPGTLRVIDNGHTIQVNFNEGSTATIRGQKYNLVQFHFHAASEHTLSGKQFPLEMHLVHKNTKGQLAVVGIFFEEGESNPFLQKIWSHLPDKKNVEQKVAGVELNAMDFFPEKKSYYNYTGSLTTPPCSEGVNWNVLNTPVSASRAQIEAYKKIYAGTNRPVQPLFGRKPANFF